MITVKGLMNLKKKEKLYSRSITDEDPAGRLPEPPFDP